MQSILFVPDTHIPFHSQKAWRLMMKAAKTLKPDIVVVLGDFADFYSVSYHSKLPGRVTGLKREVSLVRQKLKELESLKAKTYVYIEGNHEYRLTRFLQDKAPELYGLITVPELFQLGTKWDYVPYFDAYKLGKLYITHDVGFAGKTAIDRSYKAVGHNIVIGHTHRFKMQVEGTVTGERHVAASFGWLGNFDSIEYRHRKTALTEWVHGFGIGYLRANGDIHLTPVPIVSGVCVVNGKEVKA